MKSCECGCGELINEFDNKGRYRRYKLGHCKFGRFEKGMNRGSNNPRWKGGRYTTNDGYILVLKPNHPNCDSKGYVKEHRLIMEDNIGRYLNKDEDVHHINGIKTDNRIENLQFMSHGEHSRLTQHMIKNSITI